MSRQVRRRREEVVNQYSREVEAEYEVSIEFDYTPLGDHLGRSRARCTLVATPLPWCPVQGGFWAVTGEIISTANGSKELKSHLELISRARLDMQMARSYGLRECEHWVVTPA